MAKKKPETDPTTEQIVDTTAYAASIAPGAGLVPINLTGENWVPAEVTGKLAEVIIKPLFVPGEDEQIVTIHLPKAVLFALLDPSFEGADVWRATMLGLYSPAILEGGLTPLGARVIAGTDTTALRHKIATAWRLKHNAELSGSKVERA